jgi:DNA-binding response OmpR family regulator
MLELLVRRSGEVITRDEFLDTLWGKEVYITPRVVDTHMAALRKKLEDDPNNPKYILSVRGIGYKLDRNLFKS